MVLDVLAKYKQHHQPNESYQEIWWHNQRNLSVQITLKPVGHGLNQYKNNIYDHKCVPIKKSVH